MTDILNPALILAHARAWIGTPFAPRTALRGVRADCVGLLRGVWAELTGQSLTPPRWREDWARVDENPILQSLERLAIRAKTPTPGSIVTLAIGPIKAAHVGIWSGSTLIHAAEKGGVAESAPLKGRMISSVWNFPAAPGCATGPASLTAENCLAVIYPEGRRARYEITEMITGEKLAQSGLLPSRAAALALLDPIYPNIECVE